jgi:hypothetical protein
MTSCSHSLELLNERIKKTGLVELLVESFCILQKFRFRTIEGLNNNFKDVIFGNTVCCIDSVLICHAISMYEFILLWDDYRHDLERL